MKNPSDFKIYATNSTDPDQVITMDFKIEPQSPRVATRGRMSSVPLKHVPTSPEPARLTPVPMPMPVFRASHDDDADDDNAHFFPRARSEHIPESLTADVFARRMKSECGDIETLEKAIESLKERMNFVRNEIGIKSGKLAGYANEYYCLKHPVEAEFKALNKDLVLRNAEVFDAEMITLLDSLNGMLTHKIDKPASYMDELKVKTDNLTAEIDRDIRCIDSLNQERKTFEARLLKCQSDLVRNFFKNGAFTMPKSGEEIMQDWMSREIGFALY